MNAAARAADRAEEIRRAARSWRRAGAIDGETLERIGTAWPDDRVRAAPGIRVLLFAFTFIAVLAAQILLIITVDLGDDTGAALLTVAAGIALAFATELQTGALRREGGGTEEATSLLALLFLAVGGGWLILDAFGTHGRAAGPWIAVHLLSSLLCGAAAWRWGYRSYAAAAAFFLFLALARIPAGRLFWIAFGAASLPLLVRAADSARFAPSHRRCFGGVLVVAALALFLGVWIYSLDLRLVEALGGRASGESAFGAISRLFTEDLADSAGGAPAPGRTGPGGVSRSGAAGPAPGFDGDGRPLPWSGPPSPPAALRVLAAAATAFLPAFFAAWGIRARRKGMLLLAALMGLLTLATVRAYVHFVPLWAALAGLGALLLAAALLARRWLDAAPSKERGGFTAGPLFGGGRAVRAVELAAATVLFAPAAQGPQAPGPDFKPGDGSAGGAGAGGEWGP